MGYVPERITDYPQEIDDNPLHIDAGKLIEAVEKYYADPIGVKVALAIATFADGKGLAFPSVSRLSDMTGYTWTEVSKAVGRLQALGILTIQRRRFKNSRHSHNEYRFVKKFVRKVADIRSSHFLGNVQKWKAKAADVAAAVVDHAVKAVGVATGMTEKPSAPAPVMGKPADAPVEDWGSASSFPEANDPVEWDYVSEKDMDRMFRVFDAHPELLNKPEDAARLARVVFASASAAKPVSKPVEETPVKQKTSLETLPANTASVSAASSNTQPIQLDTANAPKFINGEVSAPWKSQQVLHRMNPDMYPTY